MAHALSRLPEKHFGYWEAHHLLTRAGFGGTPQQVLALHDLGLEGAVDHLLEWETVDDPLSDGTQYDSNIMRPLSREQQQMYRRARQTDDETTIEQFRQQRQARQRADRRQIRDMQTWWLERMIESPRPMQEKLTLFWHGHFATGYRSVEDSWHMLLQNQMFRRNAAGNFKNELVHGIIRDPAMIKYLNNNQNNRRSPNENLARELMELFTLGEGNGYTERDIKEGARALTGMTYDDDEFVFRARQHDSEGKSIFGRTGPHGADDFVELIFTRPSAAWFMPWKLHRFLVTDSTDIEPSTKAAVNRMASTLKRSNWEMRPMLRELLMSEHFYLPRHRQSIIKSPVQLVVQAVRSLGTPAQNMGRLSQTTGLMGQELFQPPSVKGWEGGQKWVNTSTLFVRQNTLIYLMTGREPGSSPWDQSRGGWSATPLVAHLKGLPGRDHVADAVTYLARFTLGEAPTDGRLEQWIALARDRGEDTDNTTLVHLLSLMTAAPEYQLC